MVNSIKYMKYTAFKKRGRELLQIITDHQSQSLDQLFPHIYHAFGQNNGSSTLAHLYHAFKNGLEVRIIAPHLSPTYTTLSKLCRYFSSIWQGHLSPTSKMWQKSQCLDQLSPTFLKAWQRSKLLQLPSQPTLPRFKNFKT